MISFTRELLANLREEIKAIESSQHHNLEKARLSYSKTKLSASLLISKLLTYEFKDRTEEVAFFKIHKPQFFSKLFYYKHILAIENEAVGQNQHYRKRILIHKLNKIEQFREHNAEVYQYYRKKKTDQDDLYFSRMSSLLVDMQKEAKPCDMHFSHADILFSKILATSELEEYIVCELVKIVAPAKLHGFDTLKNLGIFWTCKLRDMVELLSALQKIKAINHGNVSLKNLFEISSYLFNMEFEMKDIYNARNQIKMRKKNESSFLEKLKIVSEEEDEEYFKI